MQGTRLVTPAQPGRHRRDAARNSGRVSVGGPRLRLSAPVEPPRAAEPRNSFQLLCRPYFKAPSGDFHAIQYDKPLRQLF